MFANLFVHSHVAERLAQNTIMDGPGAQPNIVSRFRLAKRRAAIQQWQKLTTSVKACLDTLHKAAALLVGETVAFENHGVVIVERLGKMEIVIQALNEGFEGDHCSSQQVRSPAYLPG